MPANGRRRTSSWSGPRWRIGITRPSDAYEEGKLTLQEYLARVVLYQKRPFTRVQFQRFMFAQSKPYPDIDYSAARVLADLQQESPLDSKPISNFAFAN